MNQAYARRMSELTSGFYRSVASSFDATRQSPWQGWDRVLAEAGIAGESAGDDTTQAVRVLDVACGNLRFERFLQGRGVPAEVWAWDNCDALLDADGLDVHYEHVDVAAALLREAIGGDDGWLLPITPPCDLAVSFGFMHHLPLYEQREALLKALITRTRSDGYICVSFWQFANDVRLRAKAQPVVGGSEHDYLLGWQNRTDVARFCHHTTDEEIDALVVSVAREAAELSRFSADGKSGKLNRYVVLRAR